MSSLSVEAVHVDLVSHVPHESGTFIIVSFIYFVSYQLVLPVTEVAYTVGFILVGPRPTEFHHFIQSQSSQQTFLLAEEMERHHIRHYF